MVVAWIAIVSLLVLYSHAYVTWKISAKLVRAQPISQRMCASSDRQSSGGGGGGFGFKNEDSSPPKPLDPPTIITPAKGKHPDFFLIFASTRYQTSLKHPKAPLRFPSTNF
jgi:hypothetical protein